MSERPAPWRAPGGQRWARWDVLILLALAAAPFLPALAIGFLSDDFTAIGYARDLGRALSDFCGPQYGLDSPRFYRPLITLSLWADQALFGLSPLAFRLTNLAAYLGGALLAAALARRLGWGRGAAFLAGLGAAWFPFGGGSALWIVGRVDAFSVALVLAAAVVHFGGDGSAGRIRTLGAMTLFAAALLCKEVALVLPALIFALELARAGVLRAARRVAPLLGVLALYLVLRGWALGAVVGGYQQGTDLLAAGVDQWLERLGGLLQALWRLLAPWPAGAVALDPLWCALRLLPPAALLVFGARVAWRSAEARRALAALCAWVFIAAAPLVQIWGAGALETNLRAYQLAFLGLALASARILIAIRPRGIAVALGLLLLGGSLAGLGGSVRDHIAAARQVGALRAEVLAAGERAGGAPILLEGIPRAVGSAYALLFGVREAFRRPFLERDLEVIPFRPLYPHSSLSPLPEAIAARYGPRSARRVPARPPALQTRGFPTPLVISGALAATWNRIYQDGLAAGDAPARIREQLPCVMVPAGISAVRVTFLGSLGCAAGIFARPAGVNAGEELALSPIDLFLFTPITRDGEGALYLVLDTLDKGDDHIYIFVEALSGSASAGGWVSDLLRIDFDASFLPAMRVD